jgi:membrane protein
MNVLDQLRSTGEELYERANRWSGGTLAIVRDAVESYGETKASQAAAGLAYYVFFSLFPLMLVLVAAATSIWNLGSAQAFQAAVEFVSEAIPVSQDLIANNLRAALEMRGTFTLVGLLGTVWSASGAFATLSRNIDRAWKDSGGRDMIRQRLVAIVMILALVLLLLLSLASTTLLALLPQLSFFEEHFPFLATLIGSIVSRLASLIISLLIFVALYRWIPTKKAGWRAVLWGAGIAAVVWEAAKVLITYYLRSSLVNYELVYGSLAGVVALLFWIYVSASIALFCAHLTAAIDRHQASR